MNCVSDGVGVEVIDSKKLIRNGRWENFGSISLHIQNVYFKVWSESYFQNVFLQNKCGLFVQARYPGWTWVWRPTSVVSTKYAATSSRNTLLCPRAFLNFVLCLSQNDRRCNEYTMHQYWFIEEQLSNCCTSTERGRQFGGKTFLVPFFCFLNRTPSKS